MKSLLNQFKAHGAPNFFAITGDLAPHGMPDDNRQLTAETSLTDLCPTKFIVMKNIIRELKSNFPNTTFTFTMGNNDHFPKNVFWQPYFDKLGAMFVEEGFMTKAQVRDTLALSLSSVWLFAAGAC